MLRHRRQTGILFAFAIPIAIGFLLSLVPTMEFVNERIATEQIRLKPVWIYPSWDASIGTLADIKKRSGPRVFDRTTRKWVQKQWGVWLRLEVLQGDVIEWYENDSLRARFTSSQLNDFDREFIQAYSGLRSDTNSFLVSQLRAAPTASFGTYLHVLDRLDGIPAPNHLRVDTTRYSEPNTYLDTAAILKWNDMIGFFKYHSGRTDHEDIGQTIQQQIAIEIQNEVEHAVDFLNPLPEIKKETKKPYMITP
jgi:hypothetical protein